MFVCGLGRDLLCKTLSRDPLSFNIWPWNSPFLKYLVLPIPESWSFCNVNQVFSCLFFFFTGRFELGFLSLVSQFFLVFSAFVLRYLRTYAYRSCKHILLYSLSGSWHRTVVYVCIKSVSFLQILTLWLLILSCLV